MNKRGNVGDALTIIYVVFALALFGVVIWSIIDKVNDSWQSSDASAISKEAMQAGRNGSRIAIDTLFAFLFFGLPLVSMFLAYLNNIPPFLFWLSLLFVIVILLFGAFFSQLWDGMSANADFNDSSEDLPMLNFVMDHFGVYSLLVILIVAGGTYVKIRGGGL